jgi:hypothetical protein
MIARDFRVFLEPDDDYRGYLAVCPATALRLESRFGCAWRIVTVTFECSSSCCSCH